MARRALSQRADLKVRTYVRPPIDPPYAKLAISPSAIAVPLAIAHGPIDDGEIARFPDCP
jgi:hypothetical protein